MKATGKLGMVQKQALMRAASCDDADRIEADLSPPDDFDELLISFTRLLRSCVSCEGIEYEQEDINLYFIDGEIASSSISYSLSLSEENLGVLRFTRNAQFSREELILIENMVAGLLQPLRQLLDTLDDRNHYSTDPARYHKRITMEIERCHRYQKGFSLVKMSPDSIEADAADNAHNRVINETVANWIHETLDFNSRRIDTVFRTDADEFMLLLPYTNMETASYVARRIQEIIRTAGSGKHPGGQPLTMSAGVASYVAQDDVDALVQRCDIALSKAKVRGANSLSFNSGETDMTR